MSKAFAPANPYKQFDNGVSDSQPSSAPEPIFSTANNTSMTLDTVKVLETDTISTSNFKDRFKQRLLTRLQLATALLIFLLECISTGISSRSYWGWGAAICHIGTGVWVGVAGVVTAILGIVWIRRLDRNAPTRRSFTTAYFAMSILSTVFDATLSMLASVCMTQAAGYISYAKINQSYWKYLTIENAHVAVIALNGVMIGVAVANAVSNTLANVLICRSWWMSKEQRESPVTLIYLADSLTNARLPTVCVERGSRVMFLPAQSSTADGVANGTKATSH